MKKLMLFLMAAAVFALSSCSGKDAPQTEEPAAKPEGTAVIGLASPVSGKFFFTDAWGSTETDTDIRSLIFGGDTVVSGPNGASVFNTGVLRSADIYEEPNGDRT